MVEISKQQNKPTNITISTKSIKTIERESLVALGRRAITENWCGNHMDYKTGIAAIAESLAKTNPEMSDRERNDLAAELGNKAMTEIELDAE